jgi:predicted RNA polymerase sigma factor
LRLHRRATLASGFAALEEIPAGRIINYQPYWAARGHLLQLLNQKDDAQKAFTRAASLTDDPALSEYLFKRSAGTICNELKGKIHE